jgi:DNA repair exonuclease SbcCD nuclease subunit
MKVAITGDLQFAEQSKLSHLTDEGITSRLVEQVRCFLWIVDTAVERECEGLLALGDIFDPRRSIPVPVLDRTCRAFAYAAEKLWVAALAGNHDIYGREASINSLQAFLGSAEVWDEPGTDGPFAFVPWMDDPDDYRKAVGTVAREKEARYLFSHIMVEGAVPADVGKAKKDLRPQRWKRIFLGDIHEPMEFSPNIQYAGAPMQHHFGDAGGARGFWILDTDTDEIEFIENTISPRFHKVADLTYLRKHVREGDFVRVCPDDPEIAHMLAAHARQRTAWVEVEAAIFEDEDPPPRLEVSTAQTNEELLQSYVQYTEREDDGLVELGLKLLTEVG